MQSTSDFPRIGRKLLKDGKIVHLVSSVSAPLSSPNGSTVVYKHASFDSMLLIIVAAFVASMLFAWALKTLVSCAFRCNREVMGIHLSPDLAHANNGNYGNQNHMKKIDVKAMPTLLYGNMESEVKGMDCPICLAEFVEGEKLKVVPHCNHSFHVECIDKWLVCNPSCPSCRQSLLQ